MKTIVVLAAAVAAIYFYVNRRSVRRSFGELLNDLIENKQ